MSAVQIGCDGILFDSDGVLVDSDASVHASWSRWALRWSLDPDVVNATVHGRRSADTVALLIPEVDRRRALDDIDLYEVEDAAGVTALPGAAELLANLPRGTWAVVTSGRRALAMARLAAAGLPVPAVLVCAEDVPAGKPDPGGYRRASEWLGLAAERCVVVEDSAAGVAAGIAAGAAVVGVGPRALPTGATVVVRDLTGLSWDGFTFHVPASAGLR